jgi:mRNA-degrading endonuclease RelE of RelBE toxin-antitoxin system
VAYTIQFALETEQHLQSLTARQRSTVFDTIEEQLTHQPAVETRNRKPMRPNSVAPWELRVENLRVYFDVQEVPEQVVTILAIGVKEGNRVLVGGKEIEL